MSDQSLSSGVDAGGVVVRGDGAAYAQTVEAGPHRFTVDEPRRLGGADAGPNPYDLLLAALGACKTITATMYAKRKGWPLTGVTVRLRHARVHAADCADCETKEGMLDRIDCALEFVGPLTDEQRARLADIAGKCPVHRTLTSEVEIRSRVV